jgi:hypothetical protein
MNSTPADGVIRINKEEATSSHVDDLLKRQMSLRGEPGVTRDHGRKWYYQNWFVFMLVGTCGAVLAWALLEPIFADRLYYQGEIQEVNRTDQLPDLARYRDQVRELRRLIIGSIVLRGQKIYLAQGAKEIAASGQTKRLSLDNLPPGQTVGVYLEYYELPDQDLAIGEFLVRSPPPQSPQQAGMTLGQLQGRAHAAGMLLFPLVAGFIGLFIGAADGLICRLPRRALLSGVVGLLVGFVGGFVFGMLANIVYAPLTHLAMKQWETGAASMTTLGFVIQLVGRSLAWGLAGCAMGLGQGIALRSMRLLLYGLLGGVIGGLLGGLLFDPVYFFLQGPDKPGALLSRLVGIAVIGASVGAMIGVVELLARDAWLRMTQGPLTGKEFLLFKDVMNIGSSPRSDIYLFNDSLVADHHAVIRTVGDECEIEARQSTAPVLLNNRSTPRARLRHGDNVTIGRTVFVFQRRKG